MKVNHDEPCPSYDDLREIDLRTIDFAHTRLIVVDSWDQPPGLNRFLHEDKPRLPPHRVLHVPRYEQALALVRMGQGVAVATEVFSRPTPHHRVPPDPAERLRAVDRRIYQPPEKQLPDQVRHLIRIVRSYLKDLEREIRLGEPPAYDDEQYAQFCEDVLKEPEEADQGRGSSRSIRSSSRSWRKSLEGRRRASARRRGMRASWGNLKGAGAKKRWRGRDRRATPKNLCPLDPHRQD